MDVTYLALRQGSQGKEGALGVYGILENGKRVLLRLALGNQEPCKAWLSFLHVVSARDESLGTRTGRGGRTRTRDRRFWRPLLYLTELHPCEAKLPKVGVILAL